MNIKTHLSKEIKMNSNINIITLGVKDLKTSHHFYHKILKWEPHSSTNDSISFFKLNGIFLSLYSYDKLAEDAGVDHQGQGFKKFSLAINTKSIEEVDELISELRGKGVKIIKEPENAFWGGYSAYFADPDNNLWEIAFNPFIELDENGLAL